jgi:hypothetical protein
VELELEDDPLPELELEDDELELDPLDDLELTFFFLGAAGLRFTGTFFVGFAFASLSEEEVPELLEDFPPFFLGLFSETRFDLSLIDGLASSFFFLSLDDDELLLSLSLSDFYFSVFFYGCCAD